VKHHHIHSAVSSSDDVDFMIESLHVCTD